MTGAKENWADSGTGIRFWGWFWTGELVAQVNMIAPCQTGKRLLFFYSLLLSCLQNFISLRVFPSFWIQRQFNFMCVCDWGMPDTPLWRLVTRTRFSICVSKNMSEIEGGSSFAYTHVLQVGNIYFPMTQRGGGRFLTYLKCASDYRGASLHIR